LRASWYCDDDQQPIRWRNRPPAQCLLREGADETIAHQSSVAADARDDGFVQALALLARCRANDAAEESAEDSEFAARALKRSPKLRLKVV
jgi:hypothetical protein